MEFNSDGICILESITHPDECDAYVDFLLLAEKPRHQQEKLIAETFVSFAAQRLRVDCKDKVYIEALARFRDSAATRHQQDIDGIERLIPKIEEYKAKLEGKHD